MKGFLKAFFASLLALIVFCFLVFFFLAGMVSSLVKTRQPAKVYHNSVLVLDMDKPLREQPYLNPVNAILRKGDFKVQGLHELISSIEAAKKDPGIKGIYIKLNGNHNGYATNEALRRALLNFKSSDKFVFAYGDVISQRDYYVGSVADKIFLNPEGGLDFSGFAMKVMFFKGTMDKLDIKAQVFYDGKFKSATEPFRVTEMTAANKLQTRAYLGSLYRHFLEGISKQRHIDTATLFEYADKGLIQSADDALKYSLVDGLKYHDEVMQLIRQKIDLPSSDKIHFVALSDYGSAREEPFVGSSNKIAILYAQGDIVDGQGNEGAVAQIAAEKYIRLFKEIRRDSSIKAVVFRVNSPGGSALASDKIWRALMLTKQIKPVVVSMGDYAASGGYYISCAADSIFTEANTLTGSIGVFGIIPNLQSFFKNKLGITFDGVKTARYADMGSVDRPLTEGEKKIIQAGVDRIYRTFIHRVSDGRGMRETKVDSIAQGRVWSGADAVRLGLADRIGGMPAAVACAQRIAHLTDYTITTYPKPETPYEEVLQSLSGRVQAGMLKAQLGNHYTIFKQLKQLSENRGKVMARLPFVFYSN